MQQSHNQDTSDPTDTEGMLIEISYVEIFRFFSKWQRLILIVALFSFAVSAVLVRLVVPKYELTMTIAPVTPSRNSFQNSFSGLNIQQLGPISGIGEMLQPDEPFFQRYRILLLSERSARILVTDETILRTIFSDQWDQSNEIWHPSSSIGSLLRRALNATLGMPGWIAPDSQILSEFLLEEVSMRETRDGNFFTISFRHRDPAFGVKLLNELHFGTDELLRSETKIDTQRRIAFLEDRLSTVTNSSHRQLLTILLSDEHKTMMMVESDTSYAAEILIPPIASHHPVSPNGYLLFAILFLGLSMIVVVFIWKVPPESSFGKQLGKFEKRPH
jgi:hypothetical protein